MQISDQKTVITQHLTNHQRILLKWFIDTTYTNVIDQFCKQNLTEGHITDIDKLNLWLSYCNAQEFNDYVAEHYRNYYQVIRDQLIIDDQLDLTKLPLKTTKIQHIHYNQYDSQDYMNYYMPYLTQTNPNDCLTIKFIQNDFTLGILDQTLYIIDSSVPDTYHQTNHPQNTIAILDDQTVDMIFRILKTGNCHYYYHRRELVQYDDTDQHLPHVRQLLNCYRDYHGLIIPTIHHDPLKCTYDAFQKIFNAFLSQTNQLYNQAVDCQIIEHQGQLSDNHFQVINHNSIVQTLAQLPNL